MEQGRYTIDENLAKQGGTINVVSLDKKVYVNLRRGCPCNIPNLVATEQVSLTPNPKVYSMINQLKNTPTKTSLYDLIDTSHAHREVLYALFKNEIVPTNISATTFSEKLQTIRGGDVISFYKSKMLNLELLDEYSALYITPMIEE